MLELLKENLDTTNVTEKLAMSRNIDILGLDSCCFLSEIFITCSIPIDMIIQVTSTCWVTVFYSFFLSTLASLDFLLCSC
jgi:hypothetical protein